MPGAVSARTGTLVLVAAVLTASVAGRADSADDGFFELPVPGGAATLEALRIAPEERAFTLPLLARALHGEAGRRDDIARLHAAIANAVSSPDGEGLTIPAPISEDAWRDLLDVPSEAPLFPALVNHRDALLVAAAAMSADASIRTWLRQDRGLREWIVREAAGAFTASAAALRLADRAIVTPGGPGLRPAWESLVGASTNAPDRFLRALLSRDGARLAWFFEVFSSLDPDRAAWALGGGAPAEAGEQLRQLYAVFRDIDPSWRLDAHPFQRSGDDPAVLLRETALDGTALAAPASRALWDALFSEAPIRRDVLARLSVPGPPASAVWLLQRVNEGSVRERRVRFEMLRLAQRVFHDVPDDGLPDVAAALGAYRRFPALLLTLERIGIGAPAVWAAVVDAARRVDRGADRTRRTAVAVFQAALAIVERARLVHVLTVEDAERAIEALAAAASGTDPVPPSVATWIVETLVPMLPPLETPDAWTGKTAYESRILQAMAGVPGRAVARVEWEGLTHTVDLAATELERIHRLRAIIPSPGLDAAIESKRAEDFAAALVAIAYAPALGDPDGPILLSPDVVVRHDFGESSFSAERRVSGPWQPPRDMLGIEGPWHVAGAVLGLDVALWRLMMRRVADQMMPRAPTLNLNDWETLGRTVAMLEPVALDDGERDELAAAIARGRARIASAPRTTAAMSTLADEARLSPTVRQVLPWMLARQPEALDDLFALRDLLWLGRPTLPPHRLDRWGVAEEAIDGRLIPAMPRPGPWEDHAGRAVQGRVAARMPDLTLRLVEETARLGLPARLIPALLSFAVQDFGHDVDARFADDWPAMVRAARDLPSTRIEDYVAALTGTGHLRDQ